MTTPNIHSTAIVSPEAKIGEGTVIGPYTIIGKNTTLGQNNNIGPHCVIENTIMGDGNEVIASAFIGVKPQDLSYDGMESMVVMGNGNKVRECVTIHRSTSLDTPTKIGDNCLFMANSHIAHDCQLQDRIILVNSAGVAGHAEIASGAIISGMCGVHQFVRVGRLAMLSGLSGLTLDLPPFCYGVGTRAKLAGINLVGLKRAGFTREAIVAIKRAYAQLFLSKNTLQESLAILKQNNPTPEVMEMIDFIETSKRGVMVARSKAAKDEDAD